MAEYNTTHILQLKGYVGSMVESDADHTDITLTYWIGDEKRTYEPEYGVSELFGFVDEVATKDAVERSHFTLTYQYVEVDE